MGDLQVIESTLVCAARRRRWQRALVGLGQGLLFGASLCVSAIVIYKLLPVPRVTIAVAAIAGGVAVLLGMIIGGWRKFTLSETARWLDSNQRLKERISTAVELGRDPAGDSWRELLVADAISHLKGVDPRRLIRYRLSRAGRWALLLLAVAVGLGFVPEYRTKGFRQKETDQKIIKDAGEHLVELTKRSLEARPPALETTQKAMDSVSDLGKELTQKTMTRETALKDLAKVTDRMNDNLKDMAKNPDLRRMESAARARNSDESRDLAGMEKKMEELKQQAGENTAKADDLDKLNKDLEKMQEAVKAAQDQNGGMSPADKQKFAQSLAALSKQAGDLGVKLPDLQQAIEALQNSQTSTFLKDMQLSSDDLAKMQQVAQEMQQLQQQMEKIGKDLAEQLQNSQPQAAQASLQKMIDQLKSGGTTPEQMEKMLSDVSKAIDPAGHYGKTGQFLKQAAQQMKDGQKSDAAKSLADASAELDRLMQQMGDAQSMMAQLDALNKASMAIGNGQGWGQGQGMGQGQGNGRGGRGTGRGGRPGSGVGLWEDENGGWGYNGEQTGLWDNSGVKRPDMASKGLTDRGDGDVPDGLKPTQVKGQFTPGGQMPSITLKGVSIRGTSKVDLEVATTAAQSEAQSAVSQDKVPRAYQGAVRDYFDDQKK